MALSSVCVIIPAYNEAQTIGHVISQVRQRLPVADIVVMNDGSTDATREAAAAEGATVLDLPFNLGIGGAVQTGLRFAAQKGYDVAIEVDADGQHDPAFVPALLEALRAQPTIDVVIGSRFVADTHYRSSPLRRLGIHIFSYLIQFVTGQRIYDSTSGFRAYRASAIHFLAGHYPTDFPEPESIVMLLTNGFRLREIPVIMGRRTAGESVVRHDVSWRAIYFVLSNAIAILVSALKRPRHVA